MNSEPNEAKDVMEVIFIVLCAIALTALLVAGIAFLMNPSPARTKMVEREPPRCVERTDVFVGTVREISFYLAHSERQGKTGHLTAIPDKWWLNVCATDEQGKCHTVKIINAPWTWQSVGNKVDLTWEFKCTPYGWGSWQGPEIKPHIEAQ